MKYILIALIFVAFVGVCCAEIIDTDVVKESYNDASIDRQSSYAHNGIMDEVKTIKIDTGTNRIVD